jgi:hypothetical protein
MPTRDVPSRRFSVVSARPFDDIVRRLTATVGRPDMNTFYHELGRARSVAELEAVVEDSIGSSRLMEFARFNIGAFLRNEPGMRSLRILRLIVGNPVAIKDLIKTAPDAAPYVPVTILLEERADGVHVSYDTLASVIAPLECPSALALAEALDRKIACLLRRAADLPDDCAV